MGGESGEIKSIGSAVSVCGQFLALSCKLQVASCKLELYFMLLCTFVLSGAIHAISCVAERGCLPGTLARCALPVPAERDSDEEREGEGEGERRERGH